MDNMAIEEIQECLPFGEGSLVLQKRVRISEEYGPLPDVESKALYYRTSSGDMIQINQIRNIVNISRIYHIDVIQIFSNAPAALARFIADYEELGTVLMPSWRHSVFQTQYGIDLASNQPRLEGSTFRFIVADLNIMHAPHSVIEVTIDLIDMQINKRIIMEI